LAAVRRVGVIASDASTYCKKAVIVTSQKVINSPFVAFLGSRYELLV